MYQIADAAGAVMEAVINEVQSHIKAFNKHNASAWKSFKAFLAAVDWTVCQYKTHDTPCHISSIRNHGSVRSSQCTPYCCSS